MFPGFFVGTMFLFLLVRAVLGGHRYGFHRFGAWHGRPWRYGHRESLWGDFADDDFGWGHRARRGFDGGGYERAPSGRPSSDRSTPGARDGVEDAIRRFVEALRANLGATPAQKEIFEDALLRLRAATQDLRRQVDEAQRDLARALRSDTFDEVAFDAASRRMDEALVRLRAAVRAALVDVHDVLDPEQRAALADLLVARGLEL